MGYLDARYNPVKQKNSTECVGIEELARTVAGRRALTPARRPNRLHRDVYAPKVEGKRRPIFRLILCCAPHPIEWGLGSGIG
jgi:hypothetical protein